MPAPTFDLSTTGTDPKVTTSQLLKLGIDAVAAALYEEIGSIATSLRPAGNWDASGGAFPAGSEAGTYYLVDTAGTVDDESFAIGDWLIPLSADASTDTYAGAWIRGDYSKVLGQVYSSAFTPSYSDAAEMLADSKLKDGRQATLNGETFLIDRDSTLTDNGDTVRIMTDGGGGRAVSLRTSMTEAQFAADRRPQAFWTAQDNPIITITDLGYRLQPDAGSTDRTNVAAAKFRALPDELGKYGAGQFSILPATAAPTPTANATSFQTWIDNHPLHSTVSIPNWEIPLGGAINVGQRNIEGQGHASKLTFSGVDAATDLITIDGVSGGSAARSGQARHLLIDATGVGQDVIRFTGGIRAGAESVQVIGGGRDAFHFEQSAAFKYFEGAFLDNCESWSAGRHGLGIRLAPFGASTVQFFNKSLFRNSRLTSSAVSEMGIYLEDDAGSVTTKLGGGMLFYDFHCQNFGVPVSATRKATSIFIQRGASSVATIDLMHFTGGTNEFDGAGGNYGIEVNDLGAGTPIVSELRDDWTNLFGFNSSWFDYSQPPPAWVSAFTIKSFRGVLSNQSLRQFGTQSDQANKTNIGAGASATLFNAERQGQTWLVSGRSASNTGSYAYGLVLGHSTPSFVSIAQAGNLTLSISGTDVLANNGGGAPITINWAAVPIML